MSFLISKGKFVANGRKFALATAAPVPQDLIYVEDHNINIVSSNFSVTNHDLLTSSGCDVSDINLTMAGGGPGPGPRPEPIPEPTSIVWFKFYRGDNGESELRIRGDEAEGYAFTELNPEEEPRWMWREDPAIVTIENKIYPTSCFEWFYNMTQLRTINNIDNLDTRFCTSMRYMFNYCSALTSLDLSTFDTSNVTDMNSMFYYCEALTSLDVSNFDMRNVTTMDEMFYGCSSLVTLDLSSFYLANSLESAYGMFADCYELSHIYVNNDWALPESVNSSWMFGNCESLPNYDEDKTDGEMAYIGGYLEAK